MLVRESDNSGERKPIQKGEEGEVQRVKCDLSLVLTPRNEMHRSLI